LKASIVQADTNGALDRLKLEAASAIRDLPAVLGSWMRRLNREGEGLGVSVRVQSLIGLEEHLDRASNRLSLALVTLGLYVAGSLLMQHSVGPRFFGDLPILAAFVYALALWFTSRLTRAVSRSGRL
jgi:ubiquinone biosynthesis protein